MKKIYLVEGFARAISILLAAIVAYGASILLGDCEQKLQLGVALAVFRVAESFMVAMAALGTRRIQAYYARSRAQKCIARELKIAKCESYQAISRFELGRKLDELARLGFDSRDLYTVTRILSSTEEETYSALEERKRKNLISALEKLQTEITK